MRLALALASLLTAALSLAATQQPLQVYLHPAPSLPASHHLQAAPTLSASQAKAVLSHHLGQQIDDFEEIPQDEGMWGHLVGMWRGEDKPEGQKARVVIIEGGVTPQDVLPTTLPEQPAFYLPHDASTRALLAPYLQRASHFLTSVLDTLPPMLKSFKDTFEMAGTKAASILGEELSGLTAMAESIPWLDDLKHAVPWEAITISSLSRVGKDTEVWDTGRKGVQASLQAMTQSDSPPLLLIIVPSSSSHLSARALPQRRAENVTLAAACYSSNDTCSESTSCNGRGECVLKTVKGGEDCWGCRCRSGFAGVECQKTDYSVPFTILLFSSLFMIAALGGSIALLYTVGETKLPSTLTLAMGGGHAKRD